ncbi:MAG: hypothetical protein NZ777_16515 [Pseudomonadales bacterium]|nr:hypothetical protein [Pseudomonadales bacterium]
MTKKQREAQEAAALAATEAAAKAALDASQAEADKAHDEPEVEEVLDGSYIDEQLTCRSYAIKDLVTAIESEQLMKGAEPREMLLHDMVRRLLDQVTFIDNKLNKLAGTSQRGRKASKYSA